MLKMHALPVTMPTVANPPPWDGVVQDGEAEIIEFITFKTEFSDFWLENTSRENLTVGHITKKYNLRNTWCMKSLDVQGTVSWTLLEPQQESSMLPTLKMEI